MMIKFYEGEGDEAIVHLVNPKHIVTIDDFPDGSVKIELDNGRVYETKNHYFSIGDWERLEKGFEG